MQTTRQRGSHWEQAAETFLHQQGLRTLQRNYLARVGEIDLIMLDGETLVFAEVRFRKHDTWGGGSHSVTRAKQQRIIRAARRFLACHPDRFQQTCRFDVISIGLQEGRTMFDWIQNAFETD
ncbi:MAG: YraN family protein [Xanthomonadales bacterium]|nr:YraN family protein [Xanthomonadales bacterium]